MLVIQFMMKVWDLFWSVWPKNFFFLVAMSAICEAISVTLFKVSGNRGGLALLGYILGFFVVAFYAEATKYSRVTQSYPLYLVAIAICISIASFAVLHEKVSLQWLIGLILALMGIIIIQLSLPSQS